MLRLVLSSKFKKDLKRSKKRGKDLNKLYSIINKLQNQTLLDPSYKDHPLTGNYEGFRELHIEPDWLLIYAIKDDMLVLSLTRTGSHSDLFYFPKKFKTAIIINLSHLIVSIVNYSTIQNYCRCYNVLNKRNRCSYDTKCTFPKL